MTTTASSKSANSVGSVYNGALSLLFLNAQQPTLIATATAANPPVQQLTTTMLEHPNDLKLNSALSNGINNCKPSVITLNRKSSSIVNIPQSMTVFNLKEISTKLKTTSLSVNDSSSLLNENKPKVAASIKTLIKDSKHESPQLLPQQVDFNSNSLLISPPTSSTSSSTSPSTSLPYHYSESENIYICNLCNCNYDSLRSIKAHLWKHSGHHNLSYPTNNQSQVSSSQKFYNSSHPHQSTTIAKYLDTKCSSSIQMSPSEAITLMSVSSNDSPASSYFPCLDNSVSFNASSNGGRTSGGICSVLLEVVEKLCDEEEVLSDHNSHNNGNSLASNSQVQAASKKSSSGANSKERRSSRSSGRTVRHIKDLLNCSEELRRNTIEIQQNNPKRKRKTPISENMNIQNQASNFSTNTTTSTSSTNNSSNMSSQLANNNSSNSNSKMPKIITESINSVAPQQLNQTHLNDETNNEQINNVAKNESLNEQEEDNPNECQIETCVVNSIYDDVVIVEGLDNTPVDLAKEATAVMNDIKIEPFIVDNLDSHQEIASNSDEADSFKASTSFVELAKSKVVAVNFVKELKLEDILGTLANNDGNEEYICGLCSYVCYHLPSLKSHMWSHVTNQKFDYSINTSVINAALDFENKLNRKLSTIDMNYKQQQIEDRLRKDQKEEERKRNDESLEGSRKLNDEENCMAILVQDELNSIFESINYAQLQKQLSTYAKSSPMVSFRCAKCNYETIDLSNLRIHKLEHFK